MEEKDYIKLFEKFLRKQATVEEVNLLIHWLKEDASFDHWADREWTAASFEMDNQLRDRLLGQIKEKIAAGSKSGLSLSAKGKRPSAYRYALQIAATLLLLLATGMSVYFYARQQNSMQDMAVTVEKGQKATVTLPDGSKVWMNADSRLTYGKQFNAKERVLHLDGEAYFEVTPDKNRPFIVYTDDLSVRALGTSFDVKSYKDENMTSTVLMTGRVEVRSEHECLTLEPNERIVFDKQNRMMLKSNVTDAQDYSQWIQNTLSFNSETFENIALTLERYYNIRIVFASESLKHYRFTGTPGNTSLETILHILSLTSPLVYEVKDSTVILRESATQKARYEKVLSK